MMDDYGYYLRSMDPKDEDGNWFPGMDPGPPPKKVSWTEDMDLTIEMDPGRPVTKPMVNEGLEEIMEYMGKLQSASIPCCMVGTVALRYYNVPYVLDSFHVCVPTDKVDQAKEIALQDMDEKFFVRSPKIYGSDLRWEQRCVRMKRVEYEVELFIVPAKVMCAEPLFTTPGAIFSDPRTGAPVPALRRLIQSLLDCCDGIGLEELVDALDLTDTWRQENDIDLKEHVEVVLPNGTVRDRSGFWNDILEKKQTRIGRALDSKIWATRYRLHNNRDLTKVIKCKK